MSKEIKIQADPSPETRCHEQPNHTSWKKTCLIFSIQALIFVAFVAILYSFVNWLQSDAPDTHIRFSIVSVSVSELNPNASSTPEFHIVFQAKRDFETSSTKMCLYSTSSNISYHGIKIARAVEVIDRKSPCYDMEHWSEFVIPVPLSGSVPRYLRKQLWEEREITMLNLEMDFLNSSNSYHVWCHNVTLGAVHTLIPCNATMM